MADEYTWVKRSEFDELRTMVFGIRSNTFDVKYHASGLNIDYNPTSDEGVATPSTTCPAKVVSKEGIYYLCDIYADGIDSTASATTQRVFVLQLNLAETLPAGTWIMVSSSSIGQTGSGNV